MKKSFEDLVELSKFLRSPEGCPWDREQTLNTLRTFILEEAHEVIQAIEMNDIEELKEELGDLLYQILFTSQICNEEGKFTVEGVLNQLYYKLIRRHPHVFGEEKAKDAEEAVKRWHGEKVKEELEELQKAISSNEQNSIEKEWGDLIFSLVNLARFLKIDAEVSAHKAIDVFIERFNRIEEKAKDMDKTLSELTLKEMDGLWEEVKREG